MGSNLIRPESNGHPTSNPNKNKTLHPKKCHNFLVTPKSLFYPQKCTCIDHTDLFLHALPYSRYKIDFEDTIQGEKGGFNSHVSSKFPDLQSIVM